MNDNLFLTTLHLVPFEAVGSWKGSFELLRRRSITGTVICRHTKASRLVRFEHPSNSATRDRHDNKQRKLQRHILINTSYLSQCSTAISVRRHVIPTIIFIILGDAVVRYRGVFLSIVIASILIASIRHLRLVVFVEFTGCRSERADDVAIRGVERVLRHLAMSHDLGDLICDGERAR